MSDFVLYSYFRSSASYRVRIALHWKQIPFEYRAVHLLNNGGEQHTAQYKSLNPAGEVPTLVHQGRALSQSMAILQYLDEVHQPQPLFPREAALKAKVIQFCEGINCVQSYQNLKTLQFLENSCGFSPAQKDRWLQRWLIPNLEACEKILESTAGSFCFGGQVTAADVFLVPQLFAANRLGIASTDYPILTRINQTCQNLEAFQKAHPTKQPDTPKAP